MDIVEHRLVSWQEQLNKMLHGRVRPKFYQKIRWVLFLFPFLFFFLLFFFFLLCLCLSLSHSLFSTAPLALWPEHCLPIPPTCYATVLWPVNLEPQFLLYLNFWRCKHLFLRKSVNVIIQVQLVELLTACVDRNQCNLCYFTSVQIYSRIVQSMSISEHMSLYLGRKLHGIVRLCCCFFSENSCLILS